MPTIDLTNDELAAVTAAIPSARASSPLSSPRFIPAPGPAALRPDKARSDNRGQAIPQTTVPTASQRRQTDAAVDPSEVRHEVAPPTRGFVDGADASVRQDPLWRHPSTVLACNGPTSIDAMRLHGLTQDLIFGNEPEPLRAPPAQGDKSGRGGK
jgi:hypothetical protein